MIHFKAAAPDDAAAFLALMQEYYEYDAHEFHQEKARRALEPLLASPVYGLAWLIQDGKLVIGYAVITFGYSLEFGGRDAFLDELYLRENYRGRGIGTRIIQHTLDVCQTHGVKALHLEVMAQNTRAQELYRRLGFELRDSRLMSKIIG
jgi:ribosomal protein S18 acetylase RimI-like enzyme